MNLSDHERLTLDIVEAGCSTPGCLPGASNHVDFLRRRIEELRAACIYKDACFGQLVDSLPRCWWCHDEPVARNWIVDGERYAVCAMCHPPKGAAGAWFKITAPIDCYYMHQDELELEEEWDEP